MTETMDELMYIHCILYIYTVVSVYRPLELASYIGKNPWFGLKSRINTYGKLYILIAAMAVWPYLIEYIVPLARWSFSCYSLKKDVLVCI